VRYLRFCVVIAAIAAAFAPIPPAIVERWYSQRVYLGLQPLITRVSTLAPIALLDVAAAILLVLGVGVVTQRWRTRGAGAASRRTLVSIAVCAALLYLWFLSVWGLNYRRVPLEEKLSYAPSRVTREQALKFGRLAVEQVNALQPIAQPSPVEDRELSIVFAQVERELGATRHALVAQPKRSVLSWYFRKAAIDGMIDPFFLEVILNPDLLPFERPFVLAHEWSHLAGYAVESEANFIAWVTCVRASPRARYSGWLSAYEHVAAALPRDDRRALAAALTPAVAADLAAVGQRLTRSSPAVRTAARGAYDQYLRANRIEEGIANYNAVVRLMLGTSFDPAWTPALRQPASGEPLER
jgi:hypothetical protein